MALTADMYIGRITPQQLVLKPDSWCEQYVVGAHEGALTNALNVAKQRLGRRQMGMPYRTLHQHQQYLASGHGVTPGNWMPALQAKRLCIKLGYLDRAGTHSV